MKAGVSASLQVRRAIASAQTDEKIARLTEAIDADLRHLSDTEPR